MTNDTRPIGMFDSGLGGLTVAKEFFVGMPGETIIYLGDTARNPYGGRSEETIKEFGLQDACFLAAMDIKMLVIACNTVSSVAMEYIRGKLNDIPVIGVVVPGARAAVSHTASKRVGVIGTKATIRTRSYEKAITMIDPEIKTYSKPCPLFVPLVEEGLFDSDITRMVAQHYLYDFVNYGIDCIILGCTHYPMLMESIQTVMGSGVQLLDSAFWTAKEAREILTAMDIRNTATSGGMDSSRFFVTDVPDGFRDTAAAFLGGNSPNVEKINLEQLTKYTI
jgi:glutamate racemase